MNPPRQRLGLASLIWAVLVWTLLIGLSAPPMALAQKTLAHDALSFQRLSSYNLYPHLPLPSIKQTVADLPSQDPLAQKLAHQRYQMARQCNLDWVGFTDIDISVLFPIGRSDRVYRFYNCWGDASYITCYQRTKGKCRLVYQVVLNYHKRRVTKAKPVHIPTRFQSLRDYLSKEWTGAWVHPTTVNYYTLDQASPAARKDLALKRDYAIYSESGITDILSVRLLLADKVNKQFRTGDDPFTRAFLPEDQFYQKYGLPVTLEELHKIRSSKKSKPQRKSHHGRL